MSSGIIYHFLLYIELDTLDYLKKKNPQQYIILKKSKRDKLDKIFKERPNPMEVPLRGESSKDV